LVFKPSLLCGSHTWCGRINTSAAAEAQAVGRTVAVVGGVNAANADAAWVFELANGTWAQQGVSALFGPAASALPWQVALSADGTTALAGSAATDGTGAAWVFAKTAAQRHEPDQTAP
jgi:hypothetical protein